MSVRSSSSGETSSKSASARLCVGCWEEKVGVRDGRVPFLLHFQCSDCPGTPTWFGCELCLHFMSRHSRFIRKYNYERHARDNADHHQRVANIRFRATRMAADALKTPEQREMEARQQKLRQLSFEYFPHQTPLGEYFRYQVQTGNSGIYSLTIRSNFKWFDHARDILCKEEALLDFKMAAFHHKLTNQMSRTAAEIISSVYQLGMRHQSENNSNERITHRRIVPPLAWNDVNRRYLRGMNSYYQNLPIPGVQCLHDGHAYSSILECGTVALANGLSLAHVNSDMTEEMVGASYNRLWQTPRAAELAAEARRAGIPADTKVIFYILWRDDVEPNWTKSNRGSVWLFTLSFVGTGAFEKSKFCTFPLAIGKSKSPHNEVESHVHDTMRKEAAQPRYLYSGVTKSVEKVAFLPLLISTDSPEKRKATGTAMGNGTYHARFRCRADHYRLLSIIRPCNWCRNTMLAGELPDGCTECANWDVLNATEAVKEKMKLKPKKEYPDAKWLVGNKYGIRYLTDDGMLVPFRLSFARLKASYQLAFDHYANLQWTMTEVMEFLSSECISGNKLAEDLIEHGSNARTIIQIKRGDSGLDEELATMLICNSEIHPELYSCPTGMTLWYGDDDISIFVDAPMHLIFLGIMKTALFVSKKWLRKNGYLDSFLERCKKLNGLLDDVRIDWLRVEDFRDGKFGGWVSENFVAFSRVFLWFFQDIGSLIRKELLDDNSIPPSSRPNSSWCGRHYRRWLYDRDLLEKLNKMFPGQKPTNEQMKCYITRLIDERNDPPIVDRTGEHEPQQIEIVLEALYNMINILMTDEVTPEVTCPLAELRIKHFLTEFDILNQTYLEAGKKPKVITASNFLTLVNLPELMRRYGPLRQLWEGMFCGEGFVREIKPHLRYGQRVNFGSNAMKHCHKESVLEIAAAQVESGEGKRNGATARNHWAAVLESARDSFVTYDSRNTIIDRLGGSEVLSTVVFLGPVGQDRYRDKHIFIAVKAGESASGNSEILQLYRLEIDPEKTPIVKLSLRYHGWWLSPSPANWGDLLEEHPPQDYRVTFGCLLPAMGDLQDPLHMLICKDRSVST